MSGESDTVFTSPFHHNCWLVFMICRSPNHCILLTCVYHVDFPAKKGEELDKVFQDLEDLLKI